MTSDDIKVDTPLGKTVGEIHVADGGMGTTVTNIETVCLTHGERGNERFHLYCKDTILALCAALREAHEQIEDLRADKKGGSDDE